jgi:YbbR domain-containing protein
VSASERILRGLRHLRPQHATPQPEEPRPPAPTPPWRRLTRLPRLSDIRAGLSRNTGLKLVSLLLAFFLWFSINVSERDAERTVEVPVRIRHLAGGLIVTRQPTKPVEVTLRGPRTILDGVNEDRLRLGLDLSTGIPGETRIEVNGDMLRPELPRRLKVVKVEPVRLRIGIERLARRRIPVKVAVAGEPALGFKADAQVSPNEVEVSGPANRVEDLKEIETEPVDIHGANEPLTRSVLLSYSGDFVSFVPDRVEVAVSFQQVMMSRIFENVSVEVRNVRENLRPTLVPSRVELTVRGPQALLHNYRIAAGSVYVDASALDAGRHRVTPQVEVPQSLEVVRREPEVHRLQLADKGSR